LPKSHEPVRNLTHLLDLFILFELIFIFSSPFIKKCCILFSLVPFSHLKITGIFFPVPKIAAGENLKTAQLLIGCGQALPQDYGFFVIAAAALGF